MDRRKIKRKYVGKDVWKDAGELFGLGFWVKRRLSEKMIISEKVAKTMSSLVIVG